MTLTSRLSRPAAIRGVLAARGDIDAFIDRAARARAEQFSPAELVAQFRGSAGSTRRPLGAKPTDPFVDVLVHGQDITRPLDRSLSMPPERATAALGFVMTTRFYGASHRLAGLHLVATDADWSSGEGDRELRGPAGELLLVATGRPTGLAALSGSGVDEASSRIGTP
jgi:uncharacterized protein (TIGR03083 family)